MTAQAETSTESFDQEFALEAPPAEVWRALTEPDILARWLLPAADVEPGRNAVASEGIRCDLLDAVPGSRVSYRWRDGALDSIVTFAIAAGDCGGTHLRIVHTRMGFAPASRPATAARVVRSAGWHPEPANLNRSPVLLAA